MLNLDNFFGYPFFISGYSLIQGPFNYPNNHLLKITAQAIVVQGQVFSLIMPSKCL
jgi:hypothetical protein